MKIKLRKGIYKRSGEPLRFEEFEVECRGTGVKEDPFIIDSSSSIPNDFEILESKRFIIIENCHLNSIVLGYCKNIYMKNCILRSLFFYNCTDITIDNCESNFINLIECRNCLLKDSRFDTEFKLYKCYNNKFKNCYWDLFFDSDNLSRGNYLENIDHPWIEEILEIQKPLKKTTDSFAVSTFSSLYGNILKDIECRGSGTKKDPIVIDNPNIKKAKLKDLTLYHNRYYVIFKNLTLKKIKLFDSKHVILEDCTFSKSFHLKFCSDIRIISNTVKFLKFGSCQDTFIENSDIKEIDLYKGYEGTINLKNSIYQKISENALNQINVS